ncbi:MAG: carboxypeptidase-like regulatory domain-containing protein, partial [Thermoanaerobaculia bacterium]
MNLKIVHRIVAVLAVLAIGATGAVFAQDTGNLYGTVSDTDAAPLPGVTVTMTGYGADRTQITDAQGNYRFLGLDPGGYYVKAALEGFSTVEYPNVIININRNTEILITLSAAIEEVITVTSESPLLD